MKKILLITGAIVFVILLVLILIPVFFKGEILRLVERESSKYIKADLAIGDVSLNMFRRFPNLYVGLERVTIVGQEEFAGDTLVHVPLLAASVDLKSLVSGDEVVVNRVVLRDARVFGKVLASGRANWDILMAGGEESEREEAAAVGDTVPAGGSIRLNDISVENLYVAYDDQPAGLFAQVGDVDLKLSGNFSEENTVLDILLELDRISVRQGSTSWLNGMQLRWKAEIAANLKDMAFDIRKNALALNDLKLDMTGGVAVLPDGYRLDLKLNAPDTRFESLLAMIPQSFRHYLEGVEMAGEFTLAATVNGEMRGEQLPAFDLTLRVNDARLQYGEFPEAVEEINIDFQAANPGGSVDASVFDLKRLAFRVAGNPFSVSLKVSELNDMLLSGVLSGVIDFAGLKKALPIQVTQLQGIVRADASLSGRYSYIERQQFERFQAKGSVVLNDFRFVGSDFPEGVAVPEGSLTISPEQLAVKNFQAKVGASDFTLNGEVRNYLPYVFKGDVLKGRFALRSGLIDLNEFIVTDSTVSAGEDSVVEEEPMGVIAIPADMDITFTTEIGKVLFDQLQIEEVRGEVVLANSVADLTNLSMRMLNGAMVVNGAYDTRKVEAPAVDFRLKVTDFDVNAAYSSFSFLREMVPVALNCEGRVSSVMTFAAVLDEEMSPVMTTARGSGFVESKGLLINDNPTMKQLAAFLKNDELSRLSVGYLKIPFKMEAGELIVEPFTTSIASMPATFSGRQSVSGEMDYTLTMQVDRKYWGGDIENLLKNVPGSGNVSNVEVDVNLEGTTDNPTVRPDFGKVTKAVAKEAEKELKNKATDALKKEVLKGVGKLFK